MIHTRLSFKFKARITGITPGAGNKNDAEIVKPLKYPCNFWRSPKVSLINCKRSLQLTWSANCVVTNSVDAGTYT